MLFPVAASETHEGLGEHPDVALDECLVLQFLFVVRGGRGGDCIILKRSSGVEVVGGRGTAAPAATATNYADKVELLRLITLIYQVTASWYILRIEVLVYEKEV